MNNGFFISDKDKPNRRKDKRYISVRLDQDPEIKELLKSLSKFNQQNSYINEAIKFKHRYDKYRKGFLITILSENYELCRHLLRKIGWSINKGKIQDSNTVDKQLNKQCMSLDNGRKF